MKLVFAVRVEIIELFAEKDVSVEDSEVLDLFNVSRSNAGLFLGAAEDKLNPKAVFEALAGMANGGEGTAERRSFLASTASWTRRPNRSPSSAVLFKGVDKSSRPLYLVRNPLISPDKTSRSLQYSAWTAL